MASDSPLNAAKKIDIAFFMIYIFVICNQVIDGASFKSLEFH